MFVGPSLISHTAVVYRQVNEIDTEGTPSQVLEQIGEFRCGFGSVSTDRETYIGDNGQRADAAISTLTLPDVLVSDVIEVSGRNWKVIGVKGTGHTTRILLAAWGIGI